MALKQWITVGVAAALLAGSLVASAEEARHRLTPDEAHAIWEAKNASMGGRVLSLDDGWRSWKVEILSMCTLYKVKVAHSTKKVSGVRQTNYCGNIDKLRELNQKAREFSLKTIY